MENKNIKSIHTIGKVSKILLIILQVVLIIGFVGTIIGGIAVLALPSDFISIKGGGNADVTLKTSRIASKMIEIDDLEDANFHFNSFGYKINLDTTEEKISDNETVYHIAADADGISGFEIKMTAAVSCFGAAVLLALFYVAAIFAKRLAKSLEVCRSPFEENVIKAMKAFGFSLIPWAALKLLVGNIDGAIMALLVLMVLVLINIFKYGAQLQQESDETL